MADTSTYKDIAGGAWVKIYIKDEEDPNKKEEEFGLATKLSFNEDYNPQELDVLGHLGPMQYDSMGYRCEIEIGLFNPKDRGIIDTYVPSRAELQTSGKLKKYIIRVEQTGGATGEAKKNLLKFRGVIFARHSWDISPNARIEGNLSLLAMERIKWNDTDMTATL